MPDGPEGNWRAGPLFYGATKPCQQYVSDCVCGRLSARSKVAFARRFTIARTT
jgi:hypothetical protein